MHALRVVHLVAAAPHASRMAEGLPGVQRRPPSGQSNLARNMTYAQMDSTENLSFLCARFTVGVRARDRLYARALPSDRVGNLEIRFATVPGLRDRVLKIRPPKTHTSHARQTVRARPPF